MIQVSCGGMNIPFERFTFSGGEIQVKIKEGSLSKWADVVLVHAHLTSSEELFALALITDAIRRTSQDASIRLICPYLPYARQDRVCAPGESLSLKVCCDFINSLNFSTIEVWDVHSDVALALLNRVHNLPQSTKACGISFDENHVLVAPDAGSLKKISDLAKITGKHLVRADKVRDVNNGAITQTIVYSEHIGKRNFLIVDDICDGGRTFIELAKVLRPLTDGKIYLYVTHGIFSKGLSPFYGLIDHIYTALPFPDVDITDPILTVLPSEFTNGK